MIPDKIVCAPNENGEGFNDIYTPDFGLIIGQNLSPDFADEIQRRYNVHAELVGKLKSLLDELEGEVLQTSISQIIKDCKQLLKSTP